MNSKLAGHTALLVGANGGIGRATALALGRAGARLILAARDRDRLTQLHAELRTADIPATVIPTDITDDDAVARLIETAAADGMNIAINNAGRTHRPTPLSAFDPDDFDRVHQVICRGTFVALRHELLALAPGGSVVNIVSTAGLSGAPGMAAYCAAKHGVVGLTLVAALDSADRGIRVNAVAPGPIDSGGTADQPDQVKQHIGSFTPLGRLGSPAEVAEAVTWLASPASSYVTGTVLAVDGGKGARSA